MFCDDKSDRMSDEALKECLKQLGIPGLQDVCQQSFDWLYEIPGIVPFLDWLTEELTPDNVLTQQQIQEYEKLCESDGVLEGGQLEDALRCAELLDHDLSEDDLRQEISRLEENLKFVQQRKEILVRQRNKLSIQQAGLSEKTSRLSGIENSAKAAYKRSLEQSQADNIKVNSTLDTLLSAVHDLNKVYTDATSGTDQQNQAGLSCPFLSQLSLDQYNKLEDQFSQELTAFTKKQFFEGIADLAGQGGSSRYEFLDISNPDVLLVRGERENVNLDDCKELARLQALFPKSECERINSLVGDQSTMRGCLAAEEKLEHIKKSPVISNLHLLQQELEKCTGSLNIAKRDMVLLGEQEIPTLIKDGAGLKVTRILRGDYDLKIARQEYFTANQEQVINQLVVQRSRHEFLTLTYEVELKGHRETHRLLSAISTMLQENLKSIQARMALLDEPMFKTKTRQRNTVDSRNTMLHSLHALLANSYESEDQKLFLTHASLVDEAEQLNQNLSAVRASFSVANGSQDDRMKTLERNLGRCENLVFTGGAGGQPMLSSPPITDALTNLESMLRRLEQTVMDIMKTVEGKKKMLQADPLLKTERELFVYMYTDHDRLRRSLEDLSARVQATRVK